MKKSVFIIVLLVTIFYSLNVYALDTVVSMNKYDEEKFMFIENSYDAENKQDGFIAGGYVLKETIEKEDKEYQDYQAIVVKYDNKNKVVWKYLYGKTKEDYLDYLSYSYNSDGIIDGYLLVVKPTVDIGEEVSNESMFIKLSLDGKVVLEKPLTLDQNVTINKIIITHDDNNVVDGYVAIGNNGDVSYLIKLDRDLNISWEREVYRDYYNEMSYSDLSTVTSDNKIVGYVVLKSIVENEESKIQLIRYNVDGEEEVIVSEDLNKYESCFLDKANDGFILYGATTDVKLAKGDASYYLINYNSNNENNWETFGESPLDKKKTVKLLPIVSDNQIKEYLLLYSNNVGNSSEVVKITIDGEIKDKIKKIYDEYYTIEDFTIDGDILYLVGQINCPKDDTCEYDANSLFLISDEEKVIEVKDNDSRNVLIITGLFIMLIVGTVIYRKKKVLKKYK